jgi:hypothetical protein
MGGVDSDQAGRRIQNAQEILEFLSHNLGEVYNCVIREAGLQSAYQLFAIRKWRTNPMGGHRNEGTLNILD